MTISGLIFIYLLIPMALEYIGYKLKVKRFTQPGLWLSQALFAPASWCLDHIPWVQQLMLFEMDVLFFLFGPVTEP